MATSSANPNLKSQAEAIRVTPNPPVQMAYWVGVTMLFGIVGTIFGGRSVGLIFILPLVLATLAFMFKGDFPTAIATYFGYLGMEGMFKYLSGFSQAVYIISPLLLGAILAGWRMSLTNRNIKQKNPPFAVFLAMFAGWGIVQSLNPHGVGLVGSLASLMLWYVGPSLIYIVIYNTVRHQHQILTLLYVFLAVCTIISSCAILQFVLGHDWTEAHFPGYHDITQTSWSVVSDKGAAAVGSFRPAATTSMGGGGAGWAEWGAALALGLLFQPTLHVKLRVVLAACLLVNVVGLLVSGVRLWVFVGLFEALLFVFVLAKTPAEFLKNIGFLTAVTLVASIAFGGAQAISGGIIGSRYAETARNPLAKFQHDRGENVTSVASYVINYPLGSGFQQGLGVREVRQDKYDPVVRDRNGETEFGAIAADMGLPGLLLLCGIVLTVLVNGWYCLRCLKDRCLRTIGATLFISLAGYVPASFGGPVFQSAAYFWILAALLAVLPAIEKRTRQEGFMTEVQKAAP